MGYDLHITLVRDWLSAKATPIPPERWWNAVASDPELVVSQDDYTSYSGPNGESINVPAVLWRGHDDFALWFVDGEGTTSNPDDETITKLLGFAERLGCFVVGDDGEVYEPAPTAKGWRSSSEP